MDQWVFAVVETVPVGNGLRVKKAEKPLYKWD